MHHTPSIGDLSALEEVRPGQPAVSIATTGDEAERLRAIWNLLAPRDIDSDIDFFSTVVANAELALNPTIVHIRKPDGRNLMAVARREILHIPFRLGYRILGRAVVKAIVVTFDGILGAGAPADEALLMKELNRLMRRGEADFILMRNVHVDGTLFGEAQASAGAGIRTLATAPSTRWVADIPDSFDAFLQRRSGKSRATIRRKARQLEEEFKNVEVRRFSRPDEMAAMCADMETVAAASYQRKLGVGFTGAPMQLALIRQSLELDRYRMWMLYLDGQPVAFWNGFAYRGTFFIGTPGFIQDFGRHSVGSYAMMEMIKDLCDDLSISRLDFGHGEAEYKTTYGRADRVERDLYLAAPRAFPVIVLAALRSNNFLQKCAKRAVEKLGFAKRLKTRWRKGALTGT